MNTVNYRKAYQGTPCCNRVHVYGIAISADSCEVLLISGDEVSFREHFDVSNAMTVTEYFLSHPGNPNAVMTCISRARENARAAKCGRAVHG